MGIIEQKVEIHKSGYIDLSESRKIDMTLFAKFGNKIFGFIILLYIFLIFSFNKLRNE
jgi:apolipoprotein N-acyltransferase